MQDPVNKSIQPCSVENSPSVIKLIDALSKAQAVMKPAILDMENSHYKSKYASLTSVKEVYQKPLSDNGIALFHQIFSVDTSYFVKTSLMHLSGEFIATTIKLFVGKNDMQGLGSAITYAKRYSVSALLDIVDTEDDDGNASLPIKNKVPNTNQKSPQSVPKTEGTLNKPLQNHAPGGLSAAQIKRLYAIGLSKGWSSEYLRLKIFSIHKLTPSGLNKKQYDDICTNLEVRDFTAKDKAELDHYSQGLSPQDLQRITGKTIEPEPPIFDEAPFPDYENENQ